MATARGAYSKRGTHKKLLPYGATKKRRTVVTKKLKKIPKAKHRLIRRKKRIYKKI